MSKEQIERILLGIPIGLSTEDINILKSNSKDAIEVINDLSKKVLNSIERINSSGENSELLPFYSDNLKELERIFNLLTNESK